jgi:hypothetical protein
MAQNTSGFQILSNDVTIGGTDRGNLSAFNDLIAVHPTPTLQLDFINGINIQTGVSTAVNSASVDTNDGRLRLQCGTNSAGSAIFNSKKPARYRAGQGMSARFTPVFGTPRANNTQIWGVSSIINGTYSDGIGFGYNGTSFGIWYRNKNIDSWILPADWNGDKCDGTGASAFNWNTLFGVPVDIRYPYLGYGDILFYVQNPSNGRWILLHTIRYANTVNTTQFGNPSMNFFGVNTNSGNTTNVTMYAGSVGITVSGIVTYDSSPLWAMDATQAAVTSEVNLITLQNCTTYNGNTNKALMRIDGITVSFTTGNATATCRLKINPTVGGSPSFTAINGSISGGGATIASGNSVASYDVAGTTITGGVYIRSFTVTNGSSAYFDLSGKNVFLAPGDKLALSVSTTASTTVSTAINWTEDV